VRRKREKIAVVGKGNLRENQEPFGRADTRERSNCVIREVLIPSGGDTRRWRRETSEGKGTEEKSMQGKLARTERVNLVLGGTWHMAKLGRKTSPSSTKRGNFTREENSAEKREKDEKGKQKERVQNLRQQRRKKGGPPLAVKGRKNTGRRKKFHEQKERYLHRSITPTVPIEKKAQQKKECPFSQRKGSRLASRIQGKESLSACKRRGAPLSLGKRFNCMGAELGKDFPLNNTKLKGEYKEGGWRGGQWEGWGGGGGGGGARRGFFQRKSRTSRSV